MIPSWKNWSLTVSWSCPWKVLDSPTAIFKVTCSRPSWPGLNKSMWCLCCHSKHRFKTKDSKTRWILRKWHRNHQIYDKERKIWWMKFTCVKGIEEIECLTTKDDMKTKTECSRSWTSFVKVYTHQPAHIIEYNIYPWRARNSSSTKVCQSLRVGYELAHPWRPHHIWWPRSPSSWRPCPTWWSCGPWRPFVCQVHNLNKSIGLLICQINM